MGYIRIQAVGSLNPSDALYLGDGSATEITITHGEGGDVTVFSDAHRALLKLQEDLAAAQDGARASAPEASSAPADLPFADDPEGVAE